MADIKWIKLATDIFDNRKIRQIECLPDGDAIIVIWMKLLCLAGNINDNGYIYFTDEIPYTEQMLSTQFGRPINTIRLALETFERFGMIGVIDNILHIANWEKYQNVESLDKIREQNRVRQKKWYDKQKEIPNVRPNVTLTLPNATEEDKEEDKDKDIEEDKEINNLSKERYVDYESIVNAYNSICTSYPRLKSLSDSRKKAIRARLKTYSEADFITLFEKAEASDFLKGKNDRNWNATFDWLLKDSNMAKVLDGNYDNKGNRTSGIDWSNV